MQGQSLLETLLGMGLMFILGIVGTLILLKSFGTLVATKWAAQNSRCIAVKKTPISCNQATENDLIRRFAFHHVHVRAHVIHGTIHSEVDGQVGGFASVRGQYDLGASEYRRVFEK